MTQHQASGPIEPAPERVFGDLHRSIIEFERLRWGNPGALEAEVRARFGMSMTHYYAERRWLLEQPEALAYDALTVNRLRRLAERRRAHRSPGRLGVS